MHRGMHDGGSMAGGSMHGGGYMAWGMCGGGGTCMIEECAWRGGGGGGCLAV